MNKAVDDAVRESFLAFAIKSFAQLHPGKDLEIHDYVKLLAYHLAAVARGKTRRLVVTLPRPHGKATLPAARALLRSYLEAQIRRDISRYLARYCPELGRAPTAVKLRPLKSLWGSLDTRDRVMLDLALALAPPAALRYVVVHELCHLRIRSHSPRFWALVEKLYPEWREQRDWLRIHGQALKAELTRLIQSQPHG